MSSIPSSKMTKAAALLNRIAAEEDEHNSSSHNKMARFNNINKITNLSKRFPNLQAETKEDSQNVLSPTASPVKKTERPLTSVQQMIKAKEQETKANLASDFTPRPDNKSFNNRKNIFITQNKVKKPYIDDSDKLSKSEINRMGVINNAMSNSPSKKNLNKLKNIQSRLVSLSQTPDTVQSAIQTAELRPQKPKQGLLKTFSTKNINKNLTTPSSIAIRTWLDNDRDNLKLAAFVCRMVEIKRWIETVLSITIGLDDSDIDQFPDYLTNGILIAKLANIFGENSTLISKVYLGNNGKDDENINYKMTNKQFKFTENIVNFLEFTRHVKLPSLFIFETNDLYEKKDIPKVIACLHALSCLMTMLGKAPPVQKITEGEDVSSALFSLNVNIDKLKQMKHKIGRGNLGRKYVEGFDEAVRVNVGDDIKKLQLVQLEEQKSTAQPPPGETDTSKQIITEKPAETNAIVEYEKVDINKTEKNDDLESFSFLTIEEEDDSSFSDIDIDLNDNSNSGDKTEDTDNGNLFPNDSTEPSSPESEIILPPPTSEDQQYTYDARQLFNKYSNVPSMPSIHSISAIQEKYKFLIDEEEREILGGLESDSNKNEDSFLNPIVANKSGSDFQYYHSDPNIDIIALQSLARGYLLRFDLFVTKVILKGNTSSIISFQCICRGVILRKKLLSQKKVDQKKLEEEKSREQQTFENEYGSSDLMQTIIRNKTRHAELIQNLSRLREENSVIINLESAIRGMIVRSKYWKVRKHLLHEMNLIIKLQSLFRGSLIRKKLRSGSYFKSKPSVTSIKISNTPVRVKAIATPVAQKKFRARPVSHQIDDENPLLAPYNENELFEKYDIPTSPSKKASDELPEFGKVPRRRDAKREHAKYIPNLPIIEPVTPPREKRSISRLQHSPTKVSLKEFVLTSPQTSKHSSRINSVKEDIISTQQIEDLEMLAEDVTELQSILRGSLLRSKLVELIDTVYENEDIFSNFISIARGKLVRNAYFAIRQELIGRQNEVIGIQSILRGIESRVDYDCLVEDVEDCSDSVIEIQSGVRGFLARKKIRDRDAWFRKPENLQKICRLQAIIRGFHGAHDYRSLIEEKNPPIRAIKKFIGVLGNLEAEKCSRNGLEMIQLRSEIKCEKDKVKMELEKLSKLKIKVEILKKYGIDIKNVEGGLKSNVDSGNAVLKKLVDVEDITQQEDKSISTKKETNKLNEFIGSFFWILQSKPEYWSRVLNYIEMTGDLVEFSYGHIEDWILKCFNYSDADSNSTVEETREEYFYMKLVLKTFSLYISRVSDGDFKKFLKSRSDFGIGDIKFWELMIHAYLNLPQQRKLTKVLLDSIVFLITSDDEVTFECDPDMILKYLAENTNSIKEEEKLKVEIGDLTALDIQCVENRYIKNMQNLRGSTYEIFKSLRKTIDKLPVFIRSLLREFYESMKLNIDVPDNYLKGMIGILFAQCYVLPIFQNPSDYSIDIFAISDDLNLVENVIRNLQLMSILFNQCMSLAHFDPDKYPYLISLNPFIDEIHGEVKGFITELIDVPLLDISYRKVILESESGNILKIQYDDIGELVCIWREFIKEIFGDSGDLLNYRIKEIEEYIDVGNKEKVKKLPVDAYGYSIIRLSDNNDESKVEKLIGEALVLDAKRYLVYILQVQDGKDLVDLLVSEIEPADELKFKEIVKEERRLLKSSTDLTAQERMYIDEIHNLSFPQVKKHALEIVFELEKLGIISQTDGYQTLLNDIANDIKHKREQQDERDSEKDVIIEILTELKRRCRTYQKKYEEYDNTVQGLLNQRLMKGLEKQGDESSLGASNRHKDKAFLSKLFSRSGHKIKRRLGGFRSSHGSSATDSIYGTHKISLRSLLDKGVVKSISDDGASKNGIMSSSRMGISRVSVVIGCSKPGSFNIELTNSDSVFHTTLNELIDWQYEGRRCVSAFDGKVEFVCTGLLKTILGCFYSV